MTILGVRGIPPLWLVLTLCAAITGCSVAVFLTKGRLVISVCLLMLTVAAIVCWGIVTNLSGEAGLVPVFLFNFIGGGYVAGFLAGWTARAVKQGAPRRR
jgi:hypothetical protein